MSASGQQLGGSTYEDALLTGLDWQKVDMAVRLQQRNREIHTPPISLFRWWARRPHALIGAILDAAQDRSGEPPVVSDPFSGGGTVAVEAARRGLDTYAQDLHPWAITGLLSALDELDPEELAEASNLLLAVLRDERARLYGTRCREHGDGSEVLTTLWVRYVSCPSCRQSVFLYPYSYITRASRPLASDGAGGAAQVAAPPPARCSRPASVAAVRAGVGWATPHARSFRTAARAVPAVGVITSSMPCVCRHARRSRSSNASVTRGSRSSSISIVRALPSSARR